MFLIFFQGYTAFLKPFKASDFVINYILLPIFVILLVGYKVWRGTKWVELEEMDIWTGRRVENPDIRDVESMPIKKGALRRVKMVAVG